MRAFAWFLGLIALALAAIAAFTYPAWLLLHPHFDFPFHRIGERIGMLALLLGFVAVARHLKLADRASLGFGLERRRFGRELLLALLIGVATMLGVVAVMSALGLLDWTTAGLMPAALARVVAARALSALVVALIEETFLRGAMHTAIERESGTRAAILLTALIYAASHFFASFHIAAQQVSADSGVALLAGTLHAFAQPLTIADAFPGAVRGRRGARPGARRHRQHRRLHRTARRLGVGDAGGARVQPAATLGTGGVPPQPVRRVRRLAGARLDAGARRAAVALLRRAHLPPRSERALSRDAKKSLSRAAVKNRDLFLAAPREGFTVFHVPGKTFSCARGGAVVS